MADTKRVIVTGATGLIGKAICKQLNSKGYQVVVFSRDLLLLRIREIQNDARPDPEANRQQMEELLARLRAELTADRERDLRMLDERLAEYGEQRETDGYLNGMRVATGDDPAEAKVRSIRRTPPQR